MKTLITLILILNQHDWDNETLALKTFLQNEFGENWKEKASEYTSWSGGMLSTNTFTDMDATFQQNVRDANLAEGNAGPNGSYNSTTAKGTKNCN